MKVNIIGKFPGQTLNGVGILPQRGVDLSEAEVMRLLNFSNVRVFDATSGGLLTKASFAVKKKPASAVIPKKEVPVEPVPAPDTKPVELKPYFTPEVAVEEVTIESPAATADVVAVEEVPVVEEIAPAVEEEPVPVVEEVVEEEKPVVEKKPDYQKYYSKKDKHKRNRDNAAKE